MVPLLMGGMAALSIMSSMEKNKQAQANAEAQALYLAQSASITRNSIIEGSKDAQRQLAMEMTAQQKMKHIANSTVTSVMSDRNVFGGVAAKMLQQGEIESELTKANLQQASEAAVASMHSQLAQAKMEYENQVMQNSINLSNNTTSTLGMIAGAAGAAASVSMI